MLQLGVVLCNLRLHRVSTASSMADFNAVWLQLFMLLVELDHGKLLLQSACTNHQTVVAKLAQV